MFIKSEVGFGKTVMVLLFSVSVIAEGAFTIVMKASLRDAKRILPIPAVVNCTEKFPAKVGSQLFLRSNVTEYKFVLNEAKYSNSRVVKSEANLNPELPKIRYSIG